MNATGHFVAWRGAKAGATALQDTVGGKPRCA